MIEPITYCGNCPMNVPGGEYSGYCNHPCVDSDYVDKSTGQEWKGRNNEQKSIHYDLDISEANMPQKKSGNKYHFETNAIPLWCPLRELKSINIGIEIGVDLDSALFEENFISK